MFTYTHRKQTSGPGEYAQIVFDILPTSWDTVLDFRDRTVGGCVPAPFAEAVREGVLDATKRGPRGEGPLVGVRFDLVGGKTHSHDSSERAFFIAGRDGFREAILAFATVVLEPVVALDVSTSRPADALRALAGRDIVGLRTDGVRALVPQSALDALGDALLSRTGGDAEWTWRFSHYAPRR